MEAKRKVWPVLVHNSLNLAVKDSLESLKGRAAEASSKRKSFAASSSSSGSNNNNNRQQVALDRPALGDSGVLSSLSEICCVSGLITVLVGCFTAVSGVFPRNQVSGSACRIITGRALLQRNKRIRH